MTSARTTGPGRATGCCATNTTGTATNGGFPEATFDARWDGKRGLVVAPAVRIVEERKGASPRLIGDIRRALDDKSVDAIVIATPDHWHAPMAMLAALYPPGTDERRWVFNRLADDYRWRPPYPDALAARKPDPRGNVATAGRNLRWSISLRIRLMSRSKNALMCSAAENARRSTR